MAATPPPPPARTAPQRQAPPAAASPPPAQMARSAKSFTVSSGIIYGADRIGVYGTGGIGKTTLVYLMEQIGRKPLFVDLDDGTRKIEGCDRIKSQEVQTWDDLRAVLADTGLWSPYDTVVIDTLTRAEEMAAAWTLQNVKHEKGQKVDRIEDYGWGKGYTHIYETFLSLLGDLDAHIRAGRSVVVIMHDCTASVPNPMGEDYIRYEPRMQSPPSGKASIRARVKEWLDHLLFIGYDVAATKDGKAKGSGTRAIYPQEMPTHMAKSRTLSSPIVYTPGSADVWAQIFKTEQQ
jgi:hypothetical protein